MSARAVPRWALTALVMCVWMVAPRAVAAEEPTLEPEWSAAGPLAPGSLGVDEEGAAALGGTGELVVVDGDGQEQW